MAPVGNPVQLRKLQGPYDVDDLVRNAKQDGGSVHIRPDHLRSQHQRGPREGSGRAPRKGLRQAAPRNRLFGNW